MIRPRRDAGFTLIEVIVSLVLFALIAMAGVAMVDGVLRVQAETTGRLDRLASLQRAMFAISDDLEQVTIGPVAGTATQLTFNRHLAARGGGTGPISYRLAGDTIERDVGMVGRQHLLDSVAALQWRYYAPETGWIDHWPSDRDHSGDWPQAVSLDIALAPKPNQPSGTLRRIIALPTQP